MAFWYTSVWVVVATEAAANLPALTTLVLFSSTPVILAFYSWTGYSINV